MINPSTIKNSGKPKENLMVMSLSVMFLKECIYWKSKTYTLKKYKKVIRYITDDQEIYSDYSDKEESGIEV